jgi:hypothetical protein
MEVAGGEHALSEGAHEGVGLEMKVTKHCIGAPATNKTNDVGINTITKESHSTTGMETAGRNGGGINTEGEKEGSGAMAKHGCNASGGDGRRVDGGRKKG